MSEPDMKSPMKDQTRNFWADYSFEYKISLDKIEAVCVSNIKQSLAKMSDS